MRLALVVLLAVSSSGATSAPVTAIHATLVSSEPAARSRLTTSPPRVRLVFSEPIEGTLARITLVPGTGAPLVLRAAGDPRDVHAVIAPVGSLAPGTWRVDWRVVSADGHPVEGSYGFTVGDTTLATPPATGPPVAPPPDSLAAQQPEPEEESESETWGPALFGAPVIPALLRGGGLGALAAAGGMMLLLVVSGPNATQARDRNVRRTITALSLAAALLLGAHVAAWLINTSPEHQLDAAWAGAAFRTSVGQIELGRTALALLALWAWWLARRTGIALVLAGAALVVSGAVGHPSAIQPYIAIPAKAVHLLASSVWLGGLTWLVVRPAGDDATHFGVDAQRVSSLALWSVIAVTASGVVQTFLFLPTLADLATSPYGWLALAKTFGLLVLVAFGAYNRQRVMPRLARDAADAPDAPDAPSGVTLRTSVRRELVVMALVILLGGLLAYVPPPGEGMKEGSTSTPESTS